MWKRYNYVSYTLSKRMDPDWNELGALVAFGYGISGSLYICGCTLVDGVAYNATGSMTASTRNDGSGTPIVNSYTFNCRNQMTNQSATKGAVTFLNGVCSILRGAEIVGC